MICIPIKVNSLRLLNSQIKKAEKQNIDILEIWIDSLPKNLSPKDIVKLSNTPLIIVNKPKREKGEWVGCEKKRVARLKEFAIKGVTYIDIGLDTDSALIKDLVLNKKKTKVIVSYHNFTCTPSQKNLQEKVKKGFKLGADMVKIATFAKSKKDNIKVLSVLGGRNPVAAMCMGKYGKISRIMGESLGSELTFVAIDEKSKTAPGQLTVKEYKLFDSLIGKT